MVKAQQRRRSKPPAKKFVDSAARDALRYLGDQAEPPVDLFALACMRAVKKIHLRPMVGEGATYAVNGGFEIAVRDSARNEIIRLDLDDPRRPPLAPRQRFTLAHEIAHTLYYDLNGRRPVLINDTPRGDTLEALCNHAAGMFLLPDAPLLADLAGRAVSLDALRWLSKRYRASSSAVIRRIDELGVGKPDDHAVISAEIRADGVDIVAAFIPASMQVVLPRPKPYVTAFHTWGRAFVTNEFWLSDLWRREVDVYGMRLCVEKRASGNAGGFHLEISAI